MLLPANQNHIGGSGIINSSFLENAYQTFMGEAFNEIGRDVTFHLLPEKQEDQTTQAAPQQSQINPFFAGRVNSPITNTKRTGVRVVHRDVEYRAQIKIGPTQGQDNFGIGDLKRNQAVITVDVGALTHLKETISISIEGRRYSVKENRPVGFSKRKYLMILLEEINEIDVEQGENFG